MQATWAQLKQQPGAGGLQTLLSTKHQLSNISLPPRSPFSLLLLLLSPTLFLSCGHQLFQQILLQKSNM
jgi:hypothetical protein